MEQQMSLKVLILGLDGATFEIMNPLFQKGELPNLRGLMDRGAWGTLRSTIPNMSAPAWGAFMTGKNPGKLGVYDFYTYDPSKYSFLEPSLITSAPMVGHTLWDILGHMGYRVGVITIPVTYPPWEINGFMVSGYPCPDTQRNYTHPPELADEIQRCCNYSVDTKRTASLGEIAESIYQMMTVRTSLALRLLKERPCDLLCLVLGATDAAQHYFWRSSAPTFPSGEPHGGGFEDVIPNVYREADRCLGRLLQATSNETLILVLSDHGGGPVASKEVHTNHWLRNLGLLKVVRARQLTSSLQRSLLQFVKSNIRRWNKVRRLLPPGLRQRVRKVSYNVTAIDWSTTKVYRFPMSPPAEGLVVNVRGRQPEGVVEPGEEYERLRAFLIEQAVHMRDEETGESVVEKVYRREDLYSGEYLDRAPDVVILFKDRYMGGKGLEAPLMTSHPVSLIDGQHTLNGILLVQGKNIQHNYHVHGAHILDVAPSLLYALGLPVPRDMDGKILQDMFTESFRCRHSISYVEPTERAQEMKKELSPEEEQAMKEKLKMLGYLS
jgi:predicted AlkP superfamily phosphohydrolase/phosphomutase